MPRRSSWLLVSAFALTAGCSKGGEKAATPGADTTAAAAPTSPEPMAIVTKFNSNLDGSKPARYRQAELYFPSMDALKKGIATPAFKGVADDLPKFATGGFDALVAVETK
jgi:uncharacterized protein (TIGR02118 family)